MPQAIVSLETDTSWRTGNAAGAAVKQRGKCGLGMVGEGRWAPNPRISAPTSFSPHTAAGERGQQGGQDGAALGDPHPVGAGGCREEMYVVRPVRFMNSRARPGQAYVPTKFEHIANMVTHGLIIGPALLGLIWMLHLAKTSLQWWAAFVYGGSTLALFIISTTFHTLCYHTTNLRSLRDFFHIGDRAIIYIFIAASYTPWLTLKDLHGWGTFTLCVVWLGAAAGICYQYTFHEQYKWLETLFYMIVGVCPSIIITAMKESSGLSEVAIGGAIYFLGLVFFKCDGVIPFAHAIWHCFVFIGAVCHYCAVCKHLLGGATYHVESIR